MFSHRNNLVTASKRCTRGIKHKYACVATRVVRGSVSMQAVATQHMTQHQPSTSMQPTASQFASHTADLETNGIEPAGASRRLVLLGSVPMLGCVAAGPAFAKLKDYNIIPDNPIQEVSMELGTADNQFVFSPNRLEFTMGQIYKLKLSNPSQLTHYFTALEFADKVYSILVLAGEPAVEVKGSIKEVALKPGASATWMFIPIKPGTYPLKCTVKGHSAMQGELVIVPSMAAATA